MFSASRTIFRSLPLIGLAICTILLLLTPGLTVADTGGPAWTEVGPNSASGPGNTSADPSDSDGPSAAAAPDGTQYVAWCDNDNTSQTIHVRRRDGSAWRSVGAPIPVNVPKVPGWGIRILSIAVGPDGAPWIAWHDKMSGNYEIYVRRWDGTAWVEVGAGSASEGGISSNAGQSLKPSLAIARDGTPYVAWDDDTSGTRQVYVRRWDGANWVEVGTGSATGGGVSASSFAADPRLALAQDGTPYVAWVDIRYIYVRSWNGTAWVEVGSGSASGDGISKSAGTVIVPALTVGPDGKPWAAWVDSSSGNWEIYVRRWNGSAWSEVGSGSASGRGISSSPGESWLPALTIAPDGTAYCFWNDNSNGNWEVYARRWDGNAWVEVGAGSTTGGGISSSKTFATDSPWLVSCNPAPVVAPDGTLYVFWPDDTDGNWDIFVRRWTGSRWEPIDGSFGAGISEAAGDSAPSLALAPDNTPYVAWADNTSGNYEIYVRRWDGSAWVEAGAGSAGGGGISQNSGASLIPSIAIAPDGTPWVGWLDNSYNGMYAVYVRRWTGSAWVEAGEGSATGGGLGQRTTGMSSLMSGLSIAIAPDGTPYVAWADAHSGPGDIYVRRWDSTAWVEVGAGSASEGGISSNAGQSLKPSLAIARDGTPYVAWDDDTSGTRKVYVRRWDGTAWVESGAGSATGGGIANTPGDILDADPQLAAGPNGAVYAAWEDRSSGNPEIYVRRWDGTAWQEVGAGSATGRGISISDGYSAGASIAVAPDGMPCVAWHDTTSGNYDIYARCWNGSAWTEVGMGSASAGGISHNFGMSQGSSIGIGAHGTLYAAWMDDSWGAHNQIFIRSAVRPRWASAATFFDAAADFSSTSNPGGAWSYGWSPTLGGAFHLYPSHAAVGTFGGWFDPVFGVDTSGTWSPPLVLRNNGSSSVNYNGVVMQAGQLGFHPGAGGQYSIVRWTAPAAGYFAMAATFSGIDIGCGTSTDVHVLHNGVSLFDGGVYGGGAATSAPPNLVLVGPGDTLDFVVGIGNNGNNYCDSTGVAATMAAVPLFGATLQTYPEYQFSLETGAQKTEAIQLFNMGGAAHTATLDVTNPYSTPTVSLAQANPITVAPGQVVNAQVAVNAGSAPLGTYDGMLLRIAIDDGSVFYTKLNVLVTAPDAASLPDLTVSSQDVRVVTGGEGTVTLNATLHNQGTAPASDVTVQFYDLDQSLGQSVVAQVPAGGVGMGTLTVPMAACTAHLVRVVVDPAGAIQELDTGNNQASQIVQLTGCPPSPTGNILVTGSLPTTVYADALFSASGRAVYAILVNGSVNTEYAVKGGAVQVKVVSADGTQSWLYGDMHTDANGNLVRALQAPSTPGIYHLSMTVTDQTFAGTRDLVFNVVAVPPSPPLPPLPPIGIGPYTGEGYWAPGQLSGDWNWIWTVLPSEPLPDSDLRVFSEGIHFSNDHPGVDEEITVLGEIRFWSTSTAVAARNVPVNIYVTYPGSSRLQIGQTVIPNLAIGSPDNGLRYAYATWKNNQGAGIYIVEIEIDPAYAEANRLNNAATRAVVVGQPQSALGAISGQVTTALQGVGNVLIDVLDGNGLQIANAVTDPSGFYLIEDLPAATLQVRITAPAGYAVDAGMKTASANPQQVSQVDFALTRAAPPWDLNTDHVTDITDVATVGLKWQQTGAPGWIPEDVNADGAVDITDVAVIGMHWLEWS